MIRAPHGLLVVLDDDERIAMERKRFQSVEKPRIIARMQTDRRFVENVENSAQIRTELGGQPDSLRFAATKRIRGAIEGQIISPTWQRKRRRCWYFSKDICSDFLFASLKLELANDLERLAGGSAGDAGDGLPLKKDAARGCVDSRSLAANATGRFTLAENLVNPLLRQLGLQRRVEFLARVIPPDFSEAPAISAPAMGRIKGK